MLSYMWREALELRRDPVRATLALAGSLLLMFVIGFGISLDVEDLRYAVMDRDQTGLSQNYALNLSGSRYFIEHRPVTDYQDMDARMRSGELSLAIEIPQGFARDAQRGKPAQIGVWIDGAMPQRAETIRGYVLGMHQGWLAQQARERLGVSTAATASVETRFRYNPDVRSLPAMVPAVIPLLLLMMPAMLTALAVVREKELGSIINLYVTPVTRLEFLLGKQAPYVALAMLNFLLMALLAVTVFGVPVTGSFATLLLAALIYNVVATAIGLLASTFTRSQIAALFFTMIGTLVPAVQFAGLLTPVASLEGLGKLIGQVTRPRTCSPSAVASSARRWTCPTCSPRSGRCWRPYRWRWARRRCCCANRSAEMRHWSNIWRLGVKELWSLARDPMMLILITVSFTLMIYTAATAVPESLHNAAIAVVDEDGSPLSARIVSAFYPPHFTRPAMVTPAQADAGMDAGRYTFALNIPPDFQRDVLAGRPAQIQLNVDATRMSQAFTGSNYIQQIVADEINEFARRYRASAEPPVGLAVRMRFNPNLTQAWFGALMEIINNVTMLSIILTGAALIREREHGTIEHLLVMPVTPTEIMVAKVWSMGLVVLASAALSLTFIVRGLLQVPIEGSVALFLAGAALHLFATTSMGIFMATLARSMPQFGMLLVLLPLQMLSAAPRRARACPSSCRTSCWPRPPRISWS